MYQLATRLGLRSWAFVAGRRRAGLGWRGLVAFFCGAVRCGSEFPNPSRRFLSALDGFCCS